MKRPVSVALQLFGFLGLIAGSTALFEPYRGCGEAPRPVPAPVCSIHRARSTAALAAGLIRESPQLLLLRDDDGAAVVVSEAVLILLPAGELRPPAEALAAALAPLSSNVHAALRGRTTLLVWLGSRAPPLPSWDPELRLDLTHDLLGDCLARVKGEPDPRRKLSREKSNENADKVAAAEKLLVSAIGQSTPLGDGERTARLDRDRQLMDSSGVWAQRQRTFPPSAMIVLALLLVFFWRVASDDKETIAGIDASTLARDGALIVPAKPDARLLTYGLLHSGLEHLLNNCVSLYIGCVILEPALGAPRTLLIFLAGVLGGGWARLLRKKPGLLVGASGGAFALNGAALVLVLLPGAWIPQLDQKPVLVMMAIMLGAGLILSFLPNISMICHIGGALTGALLVRVIVVGRPALDGGSESPLSAGIAWALAGAAGAAWIAAGIRVRRAAR